MVLRNSGRVGSRRFTEESPVSDIGTGGLLFGDLMLDLNAETDMPSERELWRFRGTEAFPSSPLLNFLFSLSFFYYHYRTKLV